MKVRLVGLLLIGILGVAMAAGINVVTKDEKLNDPDYRWQLVTSKKYQSINWELVGKIYEATRRFKDNYERLKKSGVIYGGHFVDAEKGIIYIGLVNPTEEKKGLVLEVMKPPEGVRVVFYKADYPMEVLEEAKLRIQNSILELRERGIVVTSLDANEVTNRLEVGLKELNEENKQAILELIGDLLPPQAVRFEERRPAVPEARTDRWRPVFGGLYVETVYNGVTLASTLGFSASRDTVSGIVISGHAGDPGTPVYQPTVSSNNHLNDVSVRSPRPAAYSDSAWVPFADAVLLATLLAYQEQLLELHVDKYSHWVRL